MPKYVIEGDTVDLSTEDGGQAKILTVSPDDDDERLFVRIQSWCEGGNSHPEMDALTKFKRLRVTIETLE